jgi:4-aminobutyrate aminotransferase-like enzyme/Ser/Thr protein kinase RdoA (MazF antagonist)
MTAVQDLRPTFSAAEVVNLALEHYGLEVRAEPLPSYIDQNFLLTDAAGGRHVCKLANASTSGEALDLEHAVMARLRAADPPVPCPEVVLTLEGATWWTAPTSKGHHLVRLMTHLPGQLMVDLPSKPPYFLRSMGRFMARVDKALAGFDHPGARRTLAWDVVHTPTTVAAHLDTITDPARRSLVSDVVAAFDAVAAPVLPTLRHGVIHNDGNDHNLLVGGDPAPTPGIVGIIDFGDAVWTAIVNELAIAAAYAVMGHPDPVAAVAHVTAAYHDVHPLVEEELAVLMTLIRGRLAISVSMAAHQAGEGRTEEYLSVSEAGAWNALERLGALDPDLFHYQLRVACGFPASRASAAVEHWIGSVADPAAVLPGVDLDHPLVLDLGPGSPDIDRVDRLTDAPAWERKIRELVSAAGASAAVGRYDEPRLCYSADQFATAGAERRTVHLGQDVFAPAGTTVHAPLAGTVHSVGHNDLPLDYGPTVILEHQPTPEVSFFTLYGHLDTSCLQLEPGSAVAAGEQIGRLGDPSENGGWPPHLHFQVVVDLVGHVGNFPGVAAPSERDVWLALSPNPGPLLGLKGANGPAPAPEPIAILTAREDHLSPSLSLSYHDPLTITRGWMQWLYDHQGRAYLDGVNNVCHVGHCHPHVVAAAARQMAVLNTNTRYLHPNLVAYASRLTALFPDPLSVCFLVNSGSEANELALRLARAHTGAHDVIVLDHAYHGNTGALVDLSAYKHDGPGGTGAPDWVHVVPLPDPYRGEYRGDDAGRRHAATLSGTIEQATARGRRVAAFLGESASGCGGQVLLADGYLGAVYPEVRRAGGVCIADEVQVGFGRAGSHMWMFETQGVVPDIVTLGKPIGNGHPIGAVITTPAIAESFDTGMEYFNTFGGNPVSCAVGLAVLDVIEREGLQAHAAAVGTRLAERLRAVQRHHPLVGDVRGQGLFLGVELVRDPNSLEPADREAAYVVERLKDEGILLSTDGPHRNVLKIKPPMVFSHDDADHLAATLELVLSEVME